MKGRFGKDIGDRYQIESVKRMQDFKEVFNKLRIESSDFRVSLDRLTELSVVDMRFRKNREDIYRYDSTFESLIEMILLSKCKYIISNNSMFSKIASRLNNTPMVELKR